MLAAEGGRWRWLTAPRPADLGFALRTASAAELSLLIAMWMEMDSPQWAPLTVWVVATASRGESISKARWRLAGTAAGCIAGVALIAAFPQEPGLFFIALALWIGLCCGGATFFDGYRRYGLLVASFTSAIVAAGAVNAPDHVFDIAMARGSYIVLGIVCETALAVLFLPGMRDAARRRLPERLRSLAGKVGTGIAGPMDVEAEARLLADLVATDARIEFDVLEMGDGSRRKADHARAALVCLLAALARARGGAGETAYERDLESARRHIAAIEAPPPRDRYRFAGWSPRHAAEALENGVRAAAGIVGAALVWEVTAWPSGPAFVSFVVLVYGLLATREVPALASTGFYRGAIWCVALAGLYSFLVVPSLATPEALAVLLLPPMIAGGLAAREPRLVNYAFSFNMFLPVLLGPSNGARLDEISFLNTAAAFLCAVLFAHFTFLVVLPFRADNHLRRTAAWVARRLIAVAHPHDATTVHQWLMANAASMVRALRTGEGIPHADRLDYMHRHLDAMILGLWLIDVRDAARDGRTPLPLRRRLRAALRAWSRGKGFAPDLMARTLHAAARYPLTPPELIVALTGLGTAPGALRTRWFGSGSKTLCPAGNAESE